MDGDERRHQQYGAPYQTPTSARPNPSQQMPPPPPVTDRYAQTLQSPIRAEGGRAPLQRTSLPSYGAYGYQEQQYSAQPAHGSPMQGVETQYAPSYFNGSARQQPQQMQQQVPSQHYAQYAQNIVLQPGPSQPVYEAVPQYPQRQSTAIEVLPTQYGVPQYLPQVEHGNVIGGSGTQQFMTSQPEQPAFAQDPASARTPALPTFPNAPTEFTAVQQPETQTVADTGPGQEALDESRRQYEQQLAITFDSIRSGRVSDASQNVMELSRWLLTNIQALGLHHDNPEEHASRLEFWREFNLCWEALGQKQKDITEEALRQRRQPADILSASTLRSMVDELISLCDQIEQYGLVDYDLGVWEEQIVDIFGQCLDLLPPEDARASTAPSAAGPSTR